MYLILHFVQCSEAGQRGVVGDDVGNLMCSFDQTALGDRVEGGIQTSSLMRYVRVCNTWKVWLKVDFFCQFGNFKKTEKSRTREPWTGWQIDITGQTLARNQITPSWFLHPWLRRGSLRVHYEETRNRMMMSFITFSTLERGEAKSWKVRTPGAGWYTLQYLKYFPNLFALKYLLGSISNLPLK